MPIKFILSFELLFFLCKTTIEIPSSVVIIPIIPIIDNDSDREKYAIIAAIPGLSDIISIPILAPRIENDLNRKVSPINSPIIPLKHR